MTRREILTAAAAVSASTRDAGADGNAADLADFVGATREYTNKILVNWRSRGWIKMGRKSITPVNRKRLDDFAMKHEMDL